MNPLRARITDDWLPLPTQVIRAMNWKDGDMLLVEIAGDCLIVSLAGDQEAVTHPPPAKKRSVK